MAGLSVVFKKQEWLYVLKKTERRHGGAKELCCLELEMREVSFVYSELVHISPFNLA